MKSYGDYSKAAGGKIGEFTDLTEFENLAELEKNCRASMLDEGQRTKFCTEGDVLTISVNLAR